MRQRGRRTGHFPVHVPQARQGPRATRWLPARPLVQCRAAGVAGGAKATTRSLEAPSVPQADSPSCSLPRETAFWASLFPNPVTGQLFLWGPGRQGGHLGNQLQDPPSQQSPAHTVTRAATCCGPPVSGWNCCYMGRSRAPVWAASPGRTLLGTRLTYVWDMAGAHPGLAAATAQRGEGWASGPWPPRGRQ